MTISHDQFRSNGVVVGAQARLADKHRWAGSVLGWVTRNEYQVLRFTSIPAKLDTLVYWESSSCLTSVGTIRNTIIRHGWSRIGLAVLILYAAGACFMGRPAVISGRYIKCHTLQLQDNYAHFPPLQHTHIHAKYGYVENEYKEKPFLLVQNGDADSVEGRHLCTSIAICHVRWELDGMKLQYMLDTQFHQKRQGVYSNISRSSKVANSNFV